MAGTETLLITSAIAPPSGVSCLAMTDASLRKASTRASVLSWFTTKPRAIVIVDATNTLVMSGDDLNIADSLGIKVEQLTFSQDADEVRAKGKGIGEARLLQFAFRTSRLLQETENFFKVTGKLFVNNFDEVNTVVAANNLKSIFWRWADGSYNLFSEAIDTRFYYCNTGFFQSDLLPALLECDENNGRYMEKLAFHACTRSLTAGVAVRPVITGHGGGGGKLYPVSNYGPLEQQFPCWFAVNGAKP